MGVRCEVATDCPPRRRRTYGLEREFPEGYQSDVRPPEWASHVLENAGIAEEKKYF